VAWAAEVETEMRRGTFVSRALAQRKTLARPDRASMFK